MLWLTIKIFIAATILNLIWEFSHARLYSSYQGRPLANLSLTRLLIIMSIKDGLHITVFYLLTAVMFQRLNPLASPAPLLTFSGLNLLFSFIDEKVSLRRGRWRYHKTMPTLFGVGLSPLLELAVSGVLALIIVFYLF
jgi:hypothetical protein